jgi:imidazolonepropionase
LKPRDFEGSNPEYLEYILTRFYQSKRRKLAKRVDIFIEKSAFQPEESKEFFLKLKI